MKKLKYQIQTLDPIVVPSETGNQFVVSTRDYIPGINIIGALAAKYIKQNNLGEYFEQAKPKDSNFLNWFIKGRIGFSNAYKTDKSESKESTTFPLPFSIQHIKNNENEIIDLLYSNSPEQTKAYNSYGLLKDGKIFITNIQKSTDPHHQRDYITGAAKSSVFFNYESIDANQIFEGIITGEDESITSFLNYFSNVDRLKIGRSKTAEYGRTQFNLSEIEDISAKDIELNDDSTISLTFYSNVILYNESGFASSSFENLKKYLKEKISPNLEIEKAFLRTEEIENYVAVWRLKKNSEISFKAGSSLLLKVSADDLTELKILQDEGIGERKHEGFGRIIFGLQRKNVNYIKAKFDQEEHSKPEGAKVPELVRYTTLKIAEEYLSKVSAVEALNLVKDNSTRLQKEKKISSSQLSKLEGMVRVSSSDSEFKGKVNLLRKTAKDKLNSCHFTGGNLFEFLNNGNILINPKIKIEIQTIEKLFDDVGIERLEINNIINKLYKVYYLTLFSTIRKTIKGGKK
jgi:CRISPR-associated protein Csx10